MKKIKEKRTVVHGVFKKKTPSWSNRTLKADSNWEYADAKIEKSGCINCISTPCMVYNQDEQICGFTEMPSSYLKSVCISGAISFSEISNFPEISPKKCISCGLCAIRCNFSAIYFENGEFNLRISESINIEYRTDHLPNIIREQELVYTTENTKNQYSIIEKELIDEFHDKSSNYLKRNNGSENELIKNFLLNLGIKVKSRAIGNNDIRTDLFGLNDEFCVLCEVDTTSNDQLDLTRAILDDVAVFCSRYNVQFENIIPIIVIDKFPNKRSDFYEVLSDIENITGLRVCVLSLHLLFILNILNYKMKSNELKALFKVKKGCESIMDDALTLIPNLNYLDPYFDSDFYYSTK
jgi:ferredoxin